MRASFCMLHLIRDTRFIHEAFPYCSLSLVRGGGGGILPLKRLRNKRCTLFPT